MDSNEDDEYLSDPKNLMLLVVGMVWQRLKDLRVECGLTLEQLAEQTTSPSLRWAVMKRRTSKTSATIPLSSWQRFTA